MLDVLTAPEAFTVGSDDDYVPFASLQASCFHLGSLVPVAR